MNVRKMSVTPRCLPASLGMLMFCLLWACTPTDGGLTISPLPNPAAPGSIAPRLTLWAGTPVMSWLETTETGHTLRFATLENDVWSDVRTAGSGTDWFVNWADFPSVVRTDRSQWAAHWLVKKPGNPYAYDIATSISSDDGNTWSPPISPHDDGTASEHGFVSLFPYGPLEDAPAAAVWLDGRNTPAGGGMTLRSGYIDTNGKTLEPRLVDDLVCDCCQTDVAVASSGPVVVYRNRTTEEIRDIYVTRLRDGRWEQERSVADDGWSISGCPVNGPAIAASGDTVAVTWFTGAGSQPKIRLAFSTDSAASFGETVDVASGAVMGRVDVVLLDDGSAMVSWLQNARTSDGVVAEIRARQIRPDGSIGPDHLIAETGAGRPSGFPQMLYHGNRLLFAWTDTRSEVSQVMSANVSLK